MGQGELSHFALQKSGQFQSKSQLKSRTQISDQLKQLTQIWFGPIGGLASEG